VERHRRIHPLVESAARAVAEIGGKAVRRALDSVMEDGQRAAEELQRDILNARSHVGGDTIDVPFEVREVRPDTEDDMERVRRRERAERGGRESKPEETDDPPPSGDVAEIQDLTDMRDAETFLRHGWMLLDELADRGAYPKENASELEELLGDLRDRVEDKDGV
jgi:hypothetical protein